MAVGLHWNPAWRWSEHIFIKLLCYGQITHSSVASLDHRGERLLLLASGSKGSKSSKIVKPCKATICLDSTIPILFCAWSTWDNSSVNASLNASLIGLWSNSLTASIQSERLYWKFPSDSYGMTACLILSGWLSSEKILTSPYELDGGLSMSSHK